ncbi:HEPN domain-containing protein (plasmid) [Mycetohabitans endofungorum]
MAKAKRAYASARVLLDLGDVDGAVNRAYYAMFDAARAALLASGAPVEPDVGRTHSGLIWAFGNYLVKSSLSPCWASLCQRTRMKGEFWNYRVSSYRVIAKIQDGELLILVVRIGNL